MSIADQLNAVKRTVPHYWPIGAFIHHNPLKGFEHLHFKTALDEARGIFGGNVYMDASYFMDLHDKGKIDMAAFEANIGHFLEQHQMPIDVEFAKTFLMDVSPRWSRLRMRYLYKNSEKIDYALYLDLQENTIYYKQHAWLQRLIGHMTLYEINDALFGGNDKAHVDKEVIEFVARFLDEDQTTMPMPDRDRGMFAAFKRYEGFAYRYDAAHYVEEALQTLQVEDTEAYLLTHLLKLHGWAGFIKYRSEDPDYPPQQSCPSSLMDYMAIRLYVERKVVKRRQCPDFAAFDAYVREHRDEVILKLLRHKKLLYGPALDAMEAGEKPHVVLCSYITNELNLDALQIQHSNEVLQSTLPLTKLAVILRKLKEEEGYIWLKSLEDSYIRRHVDTLFARGEEAEATPVATATFCLDVRSEVIRRSIEQVGDYKTFGAGGFLGLPIAFVEFDKAHERFLAPAVIKPKNVVFEIPVESSQAYKTKKGVNKTTKKVLNDLKNNPYTPYIMVEAIGWIFGINLFGKTFMPERTHRLFSKIKPKKPRTTYTINKLSPEEIEFYVRKLHTKIIAKYLFSRLDKTFPEAVTDLIWRHLVFDEPLDIDIPSDVIAKLYSEFQITPGDYVFQKNKLTQVGFTLEEKVTYLHKYLTMIGQVDHFPEFVLVIGHGSVSDNNPFESALDCGACGGNVSLPNTRALCMIANAPEVKEALREKGIDIPETTRFIPGLHVTTTDAITFYDTEDLSEAQCQRFFRIQSDFAIASEQAREERAQMMPNARNASDLIKQSMDFSEPRPEWGLAGNMGVFAGPRSTIRHLALDNRFFMHSYDWRVDNDNAEILTRIFDGPLIVGEWINLEHYFSTVDNHVYGAGSKVYHNIVSKVGVFTGNYSDLKIGLPAQSVLLEGKAYHEPVRLLTYMEAPLEKVLKAVENSIAKPFILNEWIRPVVIDRTAGKVYAYQYGEFVVIKEIGA